MDRAQRQLTVAKPFYSVIIEVTMRDFKFFHTCDHLTASPDSKSVILAGDQDAARAKVPDGMVAAPVPVRELHCLPTERQRQELVAEADAKRR